MLNELLTHSIKEVLPLEISTDKEIVFLDAREKEEFKVSHIKNAKWVGYETFDPKRLKKTPKNSAIVIYCSIGFRSEKIGEQLIEMGYTNVSNLYGGIFEWINQNKKVYNSSKETQKIHTYDKEWSKWLQKGEKIY